MSMHYKHFNFSLTKKPKNGGKKGRPKRSGHNGRFFVHGCEAGRKDKREEGEERGGGRTGSTFVCISSHNRKRPVASPSQWLRFCFPPPACFPGGGGGEAEEGRRDSKKEKKLLVSKPNMGGRAHAHMSLSYGAARPVSRQTLVPLSTAKSRKTQAYAKGIRGAETWA